MTDDTNLTPGPVDGKEEYQVNKVTEFRTEPGTGKLQYKVRWKGYTNKDDSWEDAGNLHNDTLKDFWARGHTAPTYKKRKVHNTKKAKTREETLEMIRKEKERVLNEEPLVKTHYTRTSPSVNPIPDYIDNPVNWRIVPQEMRRAYFKG